MSVYVSNAQVLNVVQKIGIRKAAKELNIPYSTFYYHLQSIEDQNKTDIEITKEEYLSAVHKCGSVRAAAKELKVSRSKLRGKFGNYNKVDTVRVRQKHTTKIDLTNAQQYIQQYAAQKDATLGSKKKANIYASNDPNANHYLYIISPGINSTRLKVGISNSPHKRARKLSSFQNVYVIHAWHMTQSNAEQAERRILHILSPFKAKNAGSKEVFDAPHNMSGESFHDLVAALCSRYVHYKD